MTYELVPFTYIVIDNSFLLLYVSGRCNTGQLLRIMIGHVPFIVALWLMDIVIDTCAPRLGNS